MPIEHVQVPWLRPDRQTLARRSVTRQPDYQRLLLRAGQMAMYQGFRAKRLDQVDQQVEAVGGRFQMLGANTDGQGVPVRARPWPIEKWYKWPGRQLHRRPSARQPGGEEIHRRCADEAGDVGVGRALEHLHRRGKLGRLALMEGEETGG